MAEETISYNAQGVNKGWDTFHSFIPDWMVSMNNSMYSWKDGSLYIHNDSLVPNEYYGVQYPSKIKPVLNASPYDVKIFNTIGIEGTHPWTCNLETDMNTGSVSDQSFEEKEGEFYAYVRRSDGDVDKRSLAVQGIGEVSNYTPTLPNEADLEVDSMVSDYVIEGDKVYANVSGVDTEIGTVGSVVGQVISLVNVQNAATVGQFVFLSKNSVSESDGLRGYYMEVEMELSSNEFVELFSVSSEAIKSYQ